MQIRMLREIDAMFEGAPQSRKTLEVKEEMLQNLMEKYNDLLAEGKSEEAAFIIAIGSVGDISDLLEELQQPIPKVAKFPEPDMSGYDDVPQDAPTSAEYLRHYRAKITAIAVMLYIVSPLPVIFIGGGFGILLLFVMIAAATGLLVYNGMTGNPGKQGSDGNAAHVDAEMPENEPAPRKMSKEQKRFFGSLSSALWLLTVALYFIISFNTGAWHITWIIFLVAAALNNVLKALIDLYRGW